MTDAAAPAPATSNEPTDVDPFASGNDANLSDIFGFEDSEEPAATPSQGGDPAEPSESPAGEAVAPAESVGAGEGEEGAGSKEPAPSEPAKPADPRDLELTQMREQLKALTDAAEEAKAKPEEPAKAQDPADPADPAPADTGPAPTNFKLPKEFADAIFEEEDPAKAAGALSQLVSGVVDHANKQVYMLATQLTAMQAELAELKGGKQPSAAASAAPAGPEPTTDAVREKMQTDYFAAHPSQNKPEFLPIIQAVSSEFAAKYPNHPWDATYIASLGAAVNERASQLAKLISPAAPPRSLPKGSRSADPATGDEDVGEDIFATLSA